MEKHSSSWRQAAESSEDRSGFQMDLNNELKGSIGDRLKEITEQNIKIKEKMPPSVEVKRKSNRRTSSIDMAALTQARAEYTGHDWYLWRTCKDQRVRPSHKNIDDVLCRFSDPPSPELLIGEESIGNYGPGVAVDCRCFAEPVFLWEEVSWPHRVYSDEKIIEMTKEQFADKFNTEKIDNWV